MLSVLQQWPIIATWSLKVATNLWSLLSDSVLSVMKRYGSVDSNALLFLMSTGPHQLKLALIKVPAVFAGEQAKQVSSKQQQQHVIVL